MGKEAAVEGNLSNTLLFGILKEIQGCLLYKISWCSPCPEWLIVLILRREGRFIDSKDESP